MFFENVGRKIKIVAQIFFWIGFVLSVAGGLATAAHGCDFWDFFGGIVVILIGALLSWLVSLIPYGFGEMVEGIADIRMKLMVEKPAEKKE